MTWYKWLYIFLFFYEKDRYYSGGALRYPVKITQAFWDELHETKMEYEEKGNTDGRQFLRIDSNLGTGSDDFEEKIGKRPIVPDKIREIRETIFFLQFIICTGIIIAFLIRHK